ncbi:MAG: NADH-quinone oxidoreductase subunit N [Opitutales bacterium]
MNMLEFTTFLLPEIVLLVTAIAVIGLGCTRQAGPGNKAENSFLSASVAAGGVLVAGAILLFLPQEGRLMGNMLVLDPLTNLFKLVLLGMTFVGVILLLETPPLRHAGENFALLLFAAIGMMLVVSAEELLVIFLALELTGLSLYILVGFTKSDIRSTEAALKYFLFGSISAAFLLFGMSLVYGITGSTDLSEISVVLHTADIEPILAVGLAMTLVGFGFKVSAVPFHLWAPDVYQGAPTPAAALIASGSKVAGFFILAKVLLLGFAGVEGSAGWADFQAGWVPLVGAMAALSMVVGNLAALVQKSVRRLLAYSGIGHAGFMLIALMAATPDALSSVLFYVVIYGVTTLGAFGVVAVVLRHRGGDHLSDFAGMGRQAPLLSLCLLLFLVSLAGLPPLAGFFGKFYLFTSAMGAQTTAGAQPGMLWLVLLALFMSAVSLYYYLLVLKQVFFVEAPENAPAISSSRTANGTCAALAGVAFAVGCYPEVLLGPIRAAVGAGF